MKNKKSILYILAVCLILPVALLFSGCDSDTHTHTWSTDWTTDETNHWHICSGCEETKDLAAHIYDDEHDTTCEECGYEREIAADHLASGDWSTDETKHWHACLHDGCTFEFDSANHTAQRVLSYDETGHWYECSVCEYKIDFEQHDYVWVGGDETGHYQECQICGYQSNLVAHEYDDEEDVDCNICGYERELASHDVHTWSSDWSSDATNHWHACEGCSEKSDEAAHIYDDDHDTTCNTCGYIRTLGDHTAASVWTTDATNHWHACQHDGCTIKFNEGAHIYDNDQDTTCNTCGYVRSLHEHAWASAWTTDKTHHWHVCSGCDEKGDYAAHTPDIHGFCSVCGEFLGEKINIAVNTDYNIVNQVNLGTLEAGTHYFRIAHAVYSGSLEDVSTNLPSGSYNFYWKDYNTGAWRQSNSSCDFGATHTYDAFAYLVITITSQVTDCYISYYTHLSY